MVYEIHIKGQLDQQWSAWFDGLTISYDGEGNTILRGPLPDVTYRQKTTYFFSMASHELKTPLTLISTQVQFVLRRLTKQKEAFFVQLPHTRG